MAVAHSSQNLISFHTQCLLKFGIAFVILISKENNEHLGKSELLLLGVYKQKWGLFVDVVEGIQTAGSWSR